MTFVEFKENFLPEFMNIRSFAGRIKYANEHLSRIGSGTGRIVYDIDGERVLKLAKNTKGVAQNETEANIGYYRDTNHIVTEVFDSAEDDTWLIAEEAKKVTEKRIKELTGIPSLYKLNTFLTIVERDNKPGDDPFSNQLTDEEKSFFWENEFATDLADLVVGYNQSIGDMGRPSSYGEVLRDGQPTIVLTDYGLNDEVYNTHYNPQRKEKYRMYELFNYADGNDDILSDAGGGMDIRHGMWAQMPYTVDDGQGVINEEFIKFVSNRNRYPNKPISGLPVLTDKFHDCVNNITEIIKVVENKKQFYDNLLELQDYLISQNYYDRDPLLREAYSVNEEVPAVQRYSLDDKNYSDKLANEVAGKLRLTTPRNIGGGANGFAYEINNNLVMKITADISEADAASKLLRGQPKYLAKIFKLYKVVDTEIHKAYFVILQENILDKPVEKFRKLQNDVEKISPNGIGYFDLMGSIRIPAKFDYNNMVEFGKRILTDNPEANVSESDRQAAYEYFIGMLNIRKELIDFDIKSRDYMEIKNLGYKDGNLKFFDTGGYRATEPQMNDDSIISLPENITEEQLDEIYPKERADAIAVEIGEKLNVKPNYIAHGLFGVAYDIGNDKVLKITRDKSEAAENVKLIGKPLKYLAEPYNVYRINTKSNDIETYAIILEKLKTDLQYFERMFDRLDYVFDKIFKINYKDALEAYKDGYRFETNVDTDKIDNYFKTNPKDREFFFSILRIAEELEKYGIETIDYYNPRNLGYKKSGLIGFFDIGYGNENLQLTNPEQIDVNVNEDGSAKFSTDDAIGQDGFPTYNTNDTSPSINNDLDANIAMYEDLEYNHVKGDATDDKYEISERNKSYGAGSKTVKVKKKCQLGGLGNTSVACNQGDINNLEFGSVNEDIDASEAYRDENALQTIIDGKRGVGIIMFGMYPQLKELAINAGLNFIKIKQDSHPESLGTSIVYRDGYEKQANRLHDIMKSHGGYVADETPEEAREIGLLLGYTEDSVNKFVEKRYLQIPVAQERSYEDHMNSLDEDLEISEYFSSLVPMNEAEIMSLQDLPFKKEVEQLGGKIFSVGGAVRDEFLGKESKDLDILITGIPMDGLEKLLSKYGGVNAVGKSFGVLKFVPKGASEEIDVAIPRTETPTGEGGHQGFDVKSDHTLPIEDDLRRRDFTINAIAKDIDGNLVDPFNDQEDLKSKIIRIVNPEAFSDDPLRMLRAVQFASRFGFTIEPKTMQMIIDNADKIKEIAPERILIELDKIVTKGNPLIGIQLLSSTGLFKQIFGNEIKQSQIDRRDFTSVRTMAEFLFLMMNGVVQNPAEFYLNRFATEDAKRDKTYKELQALDIAFNSDLIDQQLTPVKARSIAHNMFKIAPQTLESQILPQIIKNAGQELLQGKYPKTVNELAVNGNDIMQRGLKGKAVGDMQKSMLIRIYADKIRNDKEELLSLISQKNDVMKESTSNASTWDINGESQPITFFVEKYDEWNNQGSGGYSDASRESVLEFLQNNYEDFSNDEKLKRELYWALTDRDLLGEEAKRVSYSAVVLDESSKIKLINLFKPMIPEGWEIIAHHMTIKMGALDKDTQEKQDMEDGKLIELKVIDYAIDNLVMAVGVEGYPTTNTKPHITLAVNRADGGKPFFSNKLTEWRPLGFPLTLTGKVTEV